MTLLADYQTSITKEELKILRKASSVCFRWQKHDQNNGNHLSCIDATITEKSKFTNQKAQYQTTIKVAATFNDYDRNTSKEIRDEFKDELQCFEWFNWANEHGGQWQTIANSLKEGDRITLKWMRNNNSELLENAGLSCDQLFLQIDRTMPSGKGKQLKFMIASHTDDRHSTARMIRYGCIGQNWIERKFSSRCRVTA